MEQFNSTREKEGARDPFRKMAEWVTDRLLSRNRNSRNRRLQEEILLLSSGRSGAVRDYYIRKWTMLCKVIPALALMAVLTVLFQAGKIRPVEETGLERPSYGEDDARQKVLVQTGDEEQAESVPLVVHSRQYTAEEARHLLEEAIEVFDSQMLGDNADADHVDRNLSFPETYYGGAVKVTYDTEPYGMISGNGEIVGTPDRAGTPVEIAADFTCQGEEMIYRLSVRVVPRTLSDEELFRQELMEAVTEADRRSAASPGQALPQQVSGRTLSWFYPEDTSWKYFLFLFALLPVLLYYLEDSRTHEQAQRRELELRADYADLLWKLTMLLGAGLTIRAAFARTAAGYARNGNARHRYLTSEMLITCREMQAGISQAQAYENFGRRCGLPCYIKLGSALSENLKKGSKGLAGELEKEAQEAMTERKNAAKQLGERAGTKILLPMILMLAVVLTVLMVPAFMNM